ncbi:hypothetical protein M413DRAFT_370935 [Hebeloma cylindrosporum]|uniref:F-box domain-containing protein n=1 Tax=Hebeloma cylindrosporum TaxID=76867 RepID=A0A0C3CID4_HEBCY|nr:hypothetical protein M413DRAFT_370935 [Hebeloma cylindrosporum h7]
MVIGNNDSVWEVSSLSHAHDASKHSDDPKAHLEGLPNELLLYILMDTSTFSVDDLYIVALVSRRFRALVLPLFLAAHGIADPEEEISLYVIEWNPSYIQTHRKPDALAGLNLSTHITRVNHFRCFFQEPANNDCRNTFQQAYDLPEAVQRTSRFIRTLQSIESCELYLVWDPYYISREKTAPHAPVAHIQFWSDAFSTLLNLIIERGVKSLRVQYDAHIDLPFHFRKENVVQKILSHLSPNAGNSGAPRWELKRPLHEEKSNSQHIAPATISSSARSANCVTSLFIHSPTLLLPPFIDWTLSLLMEHSCLTSISFAHISFTKDIWATILPYIADAVSPRLTEVSFSRNCPNLEISDLLHFISRFPNLTRLSIDRTFRSRIDPNINLRSLFPSRSIPTFPDLSELHTLQAPVELVSLLMDARKQPEHTSTPLCKLQHLTVYPCSLLIPHSSYISSTVVISSLLARIKSQSRMLPPTFAMDSQMEFTDFGAATRYLQAITTQEELQNTLRESLSEAEVIKLTREQSSSVPHIAFDHITHLLLYKFVVRLPDQTPTSLCGWLKLLFPDLKRLTFTCQADAHTTQDVRIEDMTVGWLISELRNQCPGVDVLVVGKQTYNL